MARSRPKNARRTAAWLVVLALAVPAGSLTAPSIAAAGETTRISNAPGGAAAAGNSFFPSTSADGLKVAFLSTASDLVAGDTNGAVDAFVVTRFGGPTIRLMGDGGAQPNDAALAIDLSADGRYAAVASKASNLVASDGNGLADVFRYDLTDGSVVRASVAGAGGTEVTGSSAAPSISPDGAVVAFDSDAADLVAGDTNGVRDIFVRDFRSSATTLVSSSAASVAGDGVSTTPAVSAYGSFVAFQSDATNFVSGDTNAARDVFVKSLPSGSIERVSVSAIGGQSNAISIRPQITPDGRFVAFESAGSTLVPGDANGISDVFVRDRSTGSTTIESLSSTGIAGNGESFGASISADGRLVGFTSFASNLVAGDLNGANDIFVRDRRTRQTQRASVATSGTQADAQSNSADVTQDGSGIAFTSDATNLAGGEPAATSDIFVHDLDAATLPPALTRLSTDASGRQGTDHTALGNVSADGRFVAFNSNAANLVPGDTNGVYDIFVTDRVTGTVDRVSVSSTGEQADARSGEPKISADGRYVLYFSAATNLVAGDTNGPGDVGDDAFVFDRQTRTTTRVSVSTGGVQGNNFSRSGGISADGRYVAFASLASNLVAGDTGNFVDIFVHDRVTATTTRESVASDESQSNNAASFPSISADGRYVAFDSLASNLVAGDTNALEDVFVRDRVAGTTTRVSVSASGAQANASSRIGILAADASVVAFHSAASNLVAGDTNAGADVFVRVLGGTPTTERVSVATGGAQALGGTSTLDAQQQVSADGRYVVFGSRASNLGPDANTTEDIFVRDRVAGATRLLSIVGGVPGNAASMVSAISGDGRHAVFVSIATNLVAGDTNGQSDLFAVDLAGAPTELVSKPTLTGRGTSASETSSRRAVSIDGRYVAFTSTAALVDGEAGAFADAYVHDRINGITRRVSVGSSGTQGNGDSSGAVISGDGRFVAFTSTATDLVAGDTNAAPDVFVHDVYAGTTVRASEGSFGQAFQASFSPSISHDGGYLAFASYAPNLVSGDSNGVADIFVKDLRNGGIHRVSTDSSGAQQNAAASDPSISKDGRNVAFASNATNLVTGDTNGQADIFVKDRSTNVTSRVSIATGGAQANSYSYAPSIAGGRHVAFASPATNLGPDADTFDGIFIHDRVTGVTTLESVTSTGANAFGASTAPSLSNDGRFIAFQSSSEDFGNVNGWQDAVLRDRVAGTSTVVSTRWDGQKTIDGNSQEPSVSGDGSVVVFRSHATTLDPLDVNAARDVFAHVAGPAAPSGVTISNLAITVDTPAIGAGVPSVGLSSIPASRIPSIVDGTLASTPIGSIPIGSIPIGSIPIGSIPIGSIALQSSPIGSIPIGSIDLAASPIGSIGLGDILLSSIQIDFAPILQGSPLAAKTLQNTTLAELLADSVAGPRFRALSLEDSGLATSLLRGVSVASVLLGGATLDQIGFPWCPSLSSAGYSCSANGVDTSQDTVLGLDIASAPIGSIPIGSIPIGSIPIGSIPIGSIPIGSIALLGPIGSIPIGSIPNPGAVVDCSRVNCSTQTLADAAALIPSAIRPAATLNDLGDSLDDISLGQLVIALLIRSDYPWEKLPIDGLQDVVGGPSTTYHADFDFTCPAGTPTFSIQVTPPAGFRYVANSAAFTFGASPALPGANPVAVTGGKMSWTTLPGDPCSGLTGRTQHLRLDYKMRPGFDTGDYSSKVDVAVGAATATATGATVHVVQNFEPNADPATAPILAPDTLAFGHIQSAGDVDLFRVAIPATRGTRVKIFLSKIQEGQDFDLTVFKPAVDSLESSPIGSIPIGSIPLEDRGTDLNANGESVPPETLQDIPIGSIPIGSIPIGSISQNRDSADEAAQIVTAGETGFLTVAVTGYNGSHDNSAYVLRAQIVGGATLPPCPARTFAFDADPYAGADEAAAAGALPPVLPTDRKALFLYPQARFADMYGLAKSQELLTSLQTVAARADVAGAVLAVDADPAVRTAFAAWDANPCDPGRANALVNAINDIVARYRPTLTDLRSITLVGSDEAIPMARVADGTTLSNQADYAGSLAFTTEGLTKANALYAAAALGQILTDDAYVTFTTIPWLDRELYLPSVTAGRLVETPDEIRGQLAQFVAAEGQLDPQTALTTGYDFLRDGATDVDTALTAQVGAGNASRLIDDQWTKPDLLAQFNKDVNSVNAHYDHFRLQTAKPFNGDDLVTTGEQNFAVDPLLGGNFAERLLFTMGCQAGLNVSDTLIPAGASPALKALFRDWSQMWSQQKSAVYVANTTFGYGDTATVALSEKLMAFFAEGLGDGSTTIGEKLVLAKHRYFRQAGIYGAYDEKALIASTFYGLPFYRLGPAEVPPVPPAPPALTPDPVTGLQVAAVSIDTGLSATAGRVDTPRGSYWRGQDGTHSMFYRPIQPLIQRDVTVPGATARGVIITSLASTDVPNVNAALALPTIDLGSNEPEPGYDDVLYPANMVSLSRSMAFGQERTSLVLIAGQYRPDQPADGTGTMRVFTDFGAQVAFSTAADTTGPVVHQVGVFAVDAGTARVVVRAADGAVAAKRVALMARHSDGAWTFHEAVPVPGSTDHWTADVPSGGSADRVDVLAQAQDAAGNVAYHARKGVLNPAVTDARPPQIDITTPAPAAVYTVGQDVKAAYTCSDSSGVASCIGTVPDGAAIDTATVGPKSFTVTATDFAGNSTPKTVNYFVGYTFLGFKSPIKNYPALNRGNGMRAGQTIPLKWQLKDGTGAYIRDVTTVVAIRSQTIDCDHRPPGIAEDTSSPGAALVTYDLQKEQFMYQWRTESGWVGTCRRLFLTLNDGTKRFVDVSFK